MTEVFINQVERFPSVDAITKSRFIELIFYLGCSRQINLEI